MEGNLEALNKLNSTWSSSTSKDNLPFWHQYGTRWWPRNASREWWGACILLHLKYHKVHWNI